LFKICFKVTNFTFESSQESFYDEYNSTTFTLTPTPTNFHPPPMHNSRSFIVGTAIAACIALVLICFLLLPWFIECARDNRRKCQSCFNNPLSDIERNNRYNLQIIALAENKRNTSKVEIIELVEVVVADPYDATETCSICLENIKKGDQLGSLPCGHKHFHKKCVDGWMKVSDDKSCPLCRNVSI
jgi:hypothetical protein